MISSKGLFISFFVYRTKVLNFLFTENSSISEKVKLSIPDKVVDGSVYSELRVIGNPLCLNIFFHIKIQHCQFHIYDHDLTIRSVTS